MVKLHTVRFIPALFDRGHVMAGRCRETPLRRCEDMFFRLISIENIRTGLLESTGAGVDLRNSNY